jgi:type I restriction enzyme M protein
MPKRHLPGASLSTLFSHIDEIVVATSGADTFEVVFALAAARILDAGGRAKIASARALLEGIERARRRAPLLRVARVRESASGELLLRVDALLGRALATADRYEALDALFESLVPRVAKGDKGQFFTPRHVVDFVVRALAPRRRELLVDPACGSGAFLAHAGDGVRAHGCDMDPRAVRVARLLALAQGRDPATIAHADGLRASTVPEGVASIVATNPPFAGRAPSDGFDVARVVRTPERDVLFLERALALLAPGGRLGIVLPYNKASGSAFAALRGWLVARARVLAVVGLPRETFLPHTSQRTFVLFAKKRAPGQAPDGRERTLFVVSERAGKDSAGAPSGAHDLDDVFERLAPFLAAEGFATGNAAARHARAARARTA